MKDYCDVRMLTSTFDLDPDRIRQSITATFANLNTEVTNHVPDGLGEL